MAARKKNEANGDGPSIANELRAVLPISAPLVFISHDHRDADLAEEFGNLLTDASGGILQSFRSSDRKGTAGIEFGSEWYTAIMTKLDTASDVVALLTPHSLDRPWILYEAGVAKGKLNTTVLGVAVGIELEKANAGPFAQFQNCSDDLDSLTKLVLQLIRRNPQAAPRDEAVRRQVEAFVSSVERIKKTRGSKQKQESPVDDTSVARIFEEVKVLVRDLPKRLEVQIQEGVGNRRSRQKRRIHPMMFEELLHHPIARERGQPPTVPLMIFASMIRDDYPWFFELAADLHRAVQVGDHRLVVAAQQTLSGAIEIVTHRGFFGKPHTQEEEELYYFMRHVPEILEPWFASVPAAPARKTTAKDEKKTPD